MFQTSRGLAVLLGLASILATGTVGVSRAQTAAAADAQTLADAESATKVVRVVFVGKEHACDCTRRSIDADWAALQRALGTPPKLPVERLNLDTQEDKVAPYRRQKALTDLPALYFVDAKGSVAELLQGEVTRAQVEAALAK